MPLFLLAPLASGALGFVTGWWAGDSFGWLKWLVVAAILAFGAHKLGVI
jgi:type IV secretory pathway TrbD component